jgi:hypothetical protein
LLVFIRSRSARFAALALAVATPLVASYAAPAFAAADDADVSASVNQDGDVEVHSMKGLSRVTVVLCNGDVVVSDSWGGATDGVVDVDGIVRAVFVHSGNNTSTDAETLLESLAPGAVKGESTGAIAINDVDACDDPSDDGDDDDTGGDNTGGDNTGGDNTGGDNTGGDNTGGDNTNIGDPALSISADPALTSVLGVTIEKANTPANTDVLGQTQAAPAAELPRTGAVHIQFLTALALSLLAAGLTLRATFGRRIRSVSSPG